MANMTPPYKNHNSGQQSADSSSSKSNTIDSSVKPTATTNSPSCTQSTNTISSVSTTTTTIPLEACACSKISVMQLFHEMKQKFSTVPDHIVVDYVTNNCHNRSALIEHLTKQAEANPGSVQAYPQALRNNHNIIGAGTKKPSSMTPSPIAPQSTQLPKLPNPSTPPTIASKPIASAATQSSTTLSISESSSSNDKTTLTPTSNATSPVIPTNNSAVTLSTSNNSNSGSPSDSHNYIQVPKSDSNATTSEVKNSVLPLRRPNTLNIAPESPTLPRLKYSGTSCGPTRVAPPPPDSMNVSLNVTVSPGPPPQRPPVRPVRHTTALSVQPVAFNRPPPVQHHLSPSSHPRSFTSVQFKLRQPLVTNAQSPIDISAGPSLLTYSSASYDARKGCQSRFQITVDGGTGGGTISASRTRPHYDIQPGSLNPCSHGVVSDGDELTVRRQNISKPVAGDGSGNFSGSLDEADTVLHRQLLCKQRLSMELESDRRRLYNMQREISTLLSPIPPTFTTTRLISEIQRLRQSVQQMVLEVQEAGPAYVLGETNEAFYSNIYTGQPLPRPPRPPRPPPPRPFVSPTIATPTSSIHSSASSSSAIAYDDGTNNDDGVAGGRPWCCNMCTFQNHPLLNKCEQCEMPLLTTSGTVAPSPHQHSNIPPASLNAYNSALIRQQSAMQPPHPRLQHMSYQQHSAPPVIRNPFQYTNNDGGASSGSIDASAANNVVINNTLPWLTQHTK